MIPSKLKPMLAGKVPEYLEDLRFPIVASPKLDGVRALVVNGQVLSRTLKPIPNHWVQQLFGRPEYEGFDGELIVGESTAQNCMQATMSGVMSYDGRPDVRFFVFDRWDRETRGFWGTFCSGTITQHITDALVKHTHVLLEDLAAVNDYEERVLSSGYEGLILRDPAGPYKFNRSTTREGWMLKLKRFDTAEAQVLYAVELQHNLNEANEDERGYTKRSTTQDGLLPGNTLGSLRVQDLKTKTMFNIGTGFDAATRDLLWAQRASLPGRIVTYKHFAQTGVKKAPRHPVFVAFREALDL